MVRTLRNMKELFHVPDIILPTPRAMLERMQVMPRSRKRQHIESNTALRSGGSLSSNTFLSITDVGYSENFLYSEVSI